MDRYQTEIDVPPDRYVCLQLPAALPVGRATITVRVHRNEPAEEAGPTEGDIDRLDIEWWEEFDHDDEPEGERAL